jgi:hypothetical protein
MLSRRAFLLLILLLLVSVRKQIESFESVSGQDLNLLNLLPISPRF